MNDDEIIELESRGVCVRLTAYGASILGVDFADRHGNLADVVVGCDRLEDFYKNNLYLGATCGRYANRIRGGRFTLDGQQYELAKNNGPNTLHGGAAPFSDRHWHVGNVVRVDGRAVSVCFELHSPDGEGGFPGALDVTALYQLSDEGVLSVVYSAVTDTATVLNLTNHVYWNLSGIPGTIISDHYLQLCASQYCPVDADGMVTGEILGVEGTAFDFRSGGNLGERLADDQPQLTLARGFDHAMLIDGEGERVALRLEHPASGRWMEMTTDQPAVHFYSGGHLNNDVPGKAGSDIAPYTGIALESENLPDAPNHPHWPSAVLRPGETYSHRISWKFGCA